MSACRFRCWARSRPDNTPGAGRRLLSIWRIRARRWLAWHRAQTMHEAGAARSSPAHVEPCNTCRAVSVGKTAFKILPTSAYPSQHATTNFGKVDRMMGVAFERHVCAGTGRKASPNGKRSFGREANQSCSLFSAVRLPPEHKGWLSRTSGVEQSAQRDGSYSC